MEGKGHINTGSFSNLLQLWFAAPPSPAHLSRFGHNCGLKSETLLVVLQGLPLLRQEVPIKPSNESESKC